jgi:hypothetical protein
MGTASPRKLGPKPGKEKSVPLGGGANEVRPTAPANLLCGKSGLPLSFLPPFFFGFPMTIFLFSDRKKSRNSRGFLSSDTALVVFVRVTRLTR